LIGKSPPDSDTLALRNRLIELAQARNEEAFTILYHRYLPEIGAYVTGLGGPFDKRDDLLQEIFLKAWKDLPTLRQAYSFKAWLYRIATNVVYDEARKQKRSRGGQLLSLENCPSEYEVTDPRQNFERQVEESEIVRQALGEVPWKYRMSLLLEVEGKLSREEIAEVVGISPSSVGTYISKGRQCFLQVYHRLNQSSNEERRSTL